MAVLELFPRAVYLQTLGTEPGAKSCPSNPCSIIILQTVYLAQGTFFFFKTPEESQLG